MDSDHFWGKPGPTQPCALMRLRAVYQFFFTAPDFQADGSALFSGCVKT
jgi:hypothetical protein